VNRNIGPNCGKRPGSAASLFLTASIVSSVARAYSRMKPRVDLADRDWAEYERRLNALVESAA